MTYPVQRGADGAPIEDHQGVHFAPAKPQFDESCEEGASDFPLAYAYPEDIPASDYAAGQEAAEIEATLLSDLEAAATAFWTDLDPDDGTGRSDALDTGYDPMSDVDSGQYEFRWEPGPEELIGPEPRRTLIAFRPPRARKRNSARAASFEPELRTVNFDVHATPDGAFANDLAARNKEFYELLRSNSAARKIAVPPGPARGPGFESIFPRAEPAPRQHRPAPTHRSGNSLARQAAAAAILAVVLGIGLFVIAQQFTVPATMEDSIASPLGNDPAGAPAEVASVDDPGTNSAALSSGDTPVADRPAATISTVDPGTLTTPPLYETQEPFAKSMADLSDPAPPAPEFAAIPLRTETTGTIPPAPAETAAAPEDVAPASAGSAPSSPEDPPPEIAAADPPARTATKPERESVKIATAPPAPAKEAQGTTQMLRIPAGSGKVNSAVNMRAGPDNDAKVVRVLGAGTPVEIVNCKIWCEVIAGRDRGFVFQRFIARTGGSVRAESAGSGGDAKPALPDEAEVSPREQAGGPLNLLRFGRTNN
jgi:hypothetical protein